MMKHDIDYDFWPASYWEDLSPAVAIIKNIKGDMRRKIVKIALEQDTVDELQDSVLFDHLPAEQRDSYANLHPWFLGGEDLPDYLENEVEIARVGVASKQNEIVSFRARPKGRRILYRVVDEHGTEFKIAPKSSVLPMTLRQLIKVIDTAKTAGGLQGGLAFSALEMSYRTGASLLALRDIVSISSEFYPQLSVHYIRKIDDWCYDRFVKEQRASEGVKL